MKNDKTILSIGCDLCEIVQHVEYKMQLITGKLMQPTSSCFSFFVLKMVKKN